MCWGKVTKMKGKETNEERKWWVIRCGSNRCRLDLTPSFPSFASPKCPDQQPPDISGHEHCAHTTFWLCAPLEQLPRVHETTEGSSLHQRHMKKMLLNWSRWSDLPNKGAICYPRSIEQLSGCQKDFCIIPITVLKLSGALISRKKTWVGAPQLHHVHWQKRETLQDHRQSDKIITFLLRRVTV